MRDRSLWGWDTSLGAPCCRGDTGCVPETVGTGTRVWGWRWFCGDKDKYVGLEGIL